MPATLIEKLFSTITWTLVHSLWQGLMLTVLAGFVLLLTRRSTAALRYALLCRLFFLFIIGVAVTFLVEWNETVEQVEAYTITEQTNSFPIFSLNHWQTSAASFLNQNANWIVLAWIVILLFQSGRMVREMIYIRELRNRKTWAADPFWKTKAQAYAEALGIHKTISLVESTVINVPVVIGYFKPLVMVPVGMLNHLSPGEVEAVLLHELAHIRRNDYLVNYLQRIAETVLFFNPGLLWVSSLLRAEREACCDEVAISRTGNKLQFVEALIRCKEHALQTPAFSLGLFGDRNLLLQRLNRIVSNRNKSLSLIEAAFFGVSFLALLLILSGWREGTKQSPTAASVTTTTKALAEREVINEILAQDQQKRIEEPAINNDPVVSKSSGKKNTQQKKRKARKEVFDISVKRKIPDLANGHPHQQLVVQIEHPQEVKRQATSDEVERWKLQADWNRMQAEKARQQSEIDREKAEEHRKQAERDRELSARYREQAQKDRLRAEKDRIEIQRLSERTNRRWHSEIVQ